MRATRVLSALPFVFIAVAGACNVDAPTTAPALDPSQTLTASTASAVAEARKARHDSLMALRDSIRKLAKDQREDLRPLLELQRKEWRAFKKEWKARKDGDPASGELLRCEPLEYAADAEVIGPKGGEIKIGPHKLEVPEGALEDEQLIIGTAPTSDLVQVNFEPHGLQFLQSAELTLSYAHCLAPQNYNFWLAYVDESLRIIERPKSRDKKGQDRVHGWIDHFSSYMIAY